MCHQWLSVLEFGVIAGTLSVIEIVRALSDFGSESIVYSRLSATRISLPLVVKKLIHFRLIFSIFLLVLLFLLLPVFHILNLWPLFVLLLVGTIQNTSVAFLQKERRFGVIFYLVAFIFFISVVSALYALSIKPSGFTLLFFMVIPECVSAIFGFLLTLSSWKEIFLVKKLDGKSFYRLLPYTLPSMSVGVLVMLYSRLDVMLVYPLFGANSQALYSLCMRVVEPLFMIFSLASLAFLAELGAYNNQNAKSVVSQLVNFFGFRSYFFIFLASILFGGAIGFLSKNILKLQTQEVWMISLLGSAIPTKLCNSLLSSCLQRIGHFNIVMKAAVGVFIATYFLGVIFGLLMGISGIVLAAVISEIFNFLYQKRKLFFMARGW